MTAWHMANIKKGLQNVIRSSLIINYGVLSFATAFVFCLGEIQNMDNIVFKNICLAQTYCGGTTGTHIYTYMQTM